MTIKVKLDDIWCTAEISRRDWRRALKSMARHYDKVGDWHFFKITNVKGNPKYEGWTKMYILPHLIDWNDFTNERDLTRIYSTIVQ